MTRSTGVARAIVAQISDTHIKRPGEHAYRIIDTAQALRRCVQVLNGLAAKPDIVVVSGDIADQGGDDEYRHFQEIMAPLAMPFVIVPGNHDDRDAIRRSFPAHAYLAPEGPLNAMLRLDKLDLLLLDSTVPGEPHGYLNPETLTWLGTRLDEGREHPALIFLHHPPFLTGIRHMDVQNLRNADALAEIVARHRRVRLVASGHVHRAVLTLFAGVPAVIAPGTSHAVVLDLDPASPPAFRLETPGLFLHIWTPDDAGGQLVSHVAPIGMFDGPYPFFDPAGRLM